MKDLIISVADSYQEKVFEGLLPRLPISSGTRNFSYDIIRNISNDSGSYNESHALLRNYHTDYKHSLVVFDYEGSGAEYTKHRTEIELEVESLLSQNGWENRNSVIAIEPELENWIWIDNPNVEHAIGWNKQESLYTWAKNSGYMGAQDSKPIRPKETLEKALRLSKTSKSSSIYKKIAATVSYQRCNDPAFIKFIDTMRMWFPI